MVPREFSALGAQRRRMSSSELDAAGAGFNPDNPKVRIARVPDQPKSELSKVSFPRYLKPGVPKKQEALPEVSLAQSAAA